MYTISSVMDDALAVIHDDHLRMGRVVVDDDIVLALRERVYGHPGPDDIDGETPEGEHAPGCWAGEPWAVELVGLVHVDDIPHFVASWLSAKGCVPICDPLPVAPVIVRESVEAVVKGRIRVHVTLG